MRLTLAMIATCLLAGAATAQSQRTVPVYTGQVTYENSQSFTTALANRVDTIVGVKASVAPTEAGVLNGYLVDSMADDAGVYISRTEGRMGGIQINAPSAYWRHGNYIIDGFFVVKYGGMGQGVMGYQLKPVDEAAVLLSQVPHVEVRVDAIPVEEQAAVAD